MKLRFLSLLSLMLLFICAKAGAQAFEQDCINAIPVCGPFYSQTNSYVGTGTYPAELTTINQGCLGSGEKNDVWYIINVSASGTLAFTITPNNLANDYDFAVWDITNVGCQAIFNYTTNTANAYPPVGCNYSGTPGQTGLSNTIVGSQWSPALNVIAGQTLVLNVSNFSSSQSGYSLDFGPSTASIFDTIPPTLVNIFTQCQFPSNQLLLKTSEPIKCNTISATGSEFSLSPAVSGVNVTSATGLNCTAGPNSATNSISLNFSGVVPAGTYWLHINNGTDGNTLLDNCGNAVSPSDSIQFTLVPPNPPAMITVDTPACIKARVHFDRSFKCSTLSPDGSNFVISGPGNVAVAKAIVIGCDKDLGSVVDVYFTKAVEIPGTYTISTKVGSNTLSISDTCNLAVANTIDFVVSDHGYVFSSANPSILCYPGYTQLDASSNVGGPASPVVCGANGTLCGGISADYIVGSPLAAGTTVNTPFYGSNANARTQMLFKASELLNSGLVNGTINQLSLNVTNKTSTGPYTLTIKMGCTTDTALTAYESNLPVVYATKPYTTATGVNTFPLDNLYDWDGSSNLVVELCYTATASGDDDVLTTSGLFTGAVLHNHLNTAIDGCALSAVATSNSDSRPNLTFTECNRPSGPISFAWQPGNFTNDSTSAATQAYAPYSRSFVVRIQDSNFCYRRSYDSITVSVRHPLLQSSDTGICIGLSAYLHVTGGDHYEWYPATALSCVSCPDPIASPTENTTYYVIVYDNLGCSDTLHENITVNPLPNVYASPDTIINYGSSVQLFVVSPGAKYYRWDPATGVNVPTIANPIVSPLIGTQYVIHVTDTNQCENTDTVFVNVNREVPVFVPSAFTPNNDGVNDIFHVANLTFQRIQEFRIFNRWGQQIFNASDNSGWDGRYKGVPQDIGNYSYIIKVAWPDGAVKTFKGEVNLIR